MKIITAIACAALALPAIADEQFGELTTESPTWDRISTTGLTADGTCGGAIAIDSVNDAVPYEKYYIQASAPNTPLEVRAKSQHANSIDFDPFLAVYCGSFDPLQPMMNLLHADDDSLSFPNALVYLPPEDFVLAPDQTLVVIVTTYSNWAPTQYGEYEIILGDNLIFVNPCAADLNGDGVLNFFDVSAFLTAFNATDPSADFNNDGMFNFFDVSAFLAEFNAGCP